MLHQSPENSPNLSPRSTAFERGKFGRLFPDLLPQSEEEPDIRALNALAGDMVRGANSVSASKVPAGYTYLGQFIAHDLSFDPTTIGERMTDPEFLWNFRTPALDLDSVYGGGPMVSPYFYDDDYQFIVSAKGMDVKNAELEDLALVDFQRNTNGVAIIADPRNDENMIVAKIHLLFQLLHNHFIQANKSGNRSKKSVFEEAKKQTIWHYQWIVLYDYLPRIIGRDLVEKFLNLELAYSKGRKQYNWRNEPFIPIEFAAAAFRFGHTQVRDFYQIGNNKIGAFIPNRFNDGIDLRLKTKFPIHLDLKLFFFNTSKPGMDHNFAHPIEPHISSALASVPSFNHPPESQIAQKMDFMDFLSNAVEKAGFDKLFNGFINAGNAQETWNDILDAAKATDAALAINKMLNAKQGRLKKRDSNKPKENIVAQKIDEILADLSSGPIREQMLALNKALDNFVPRFENLAFRTLLKGCKMALPSGQDVARLIGSHPETLDFNGDEYLNDKFGGNTPLWYYILHEAKDLEKNQAYCQRLGQVGATIVGEVIIGLIDGDDTSFRNQFPAWKPKKMEEIKEVPQKLADIHSDDESKNFTMADLIELVAGK